MKARPTSGEGGRLRVRSWTAPTSIVRCRSLAIALLALAAPGCCLYPPGFVPRIEPECTYWDFTASRDEVRGLANDIADQLSDVDSPRDPGVTIDYKGLKAAAIKMARAPVCVQRAVIESYCREYCREHSLDVKASGLLLLMRVLFVVPSRHPASDARKHHAWLQPSDFRPPESPLETEFDLAWPVHADPRGHVLEIVQRLGRGSYYNALGEYDYFAERFRRRTPVEIEALEIRAREGILSSAELGNHGVAQRLGGRSRGAGGKVIV